MQTYEVQASESMDALLQTLAHLARTDREVTLVVPADAAMLRQVDNLSRLRHFAADQKIQLHAAVADRVMLGLFRIIGIDATEDNGTRSRTSAPAPPPPPL